MQRKAEKEEKKEDVERIRAISVPVGNVQHANEGGGLVDWEKKYGELMEKVSVFSLFLSVVC